jgi:hypothetical protein
MLQKVLPELSGSNPETDRRFKFTPCNKIESHKFTVRVTAHRQMCILYNQRDATYAMFFIIISALHVSGSFSTHHQELIKLYAQSWVLSCFPAVYCWCGWVGTVFV